MTTTDDFAALIDPALLDAIRVITERASPVSAPTHHRRRWAVSARWRHAYLGGPVDPGEVITPLCDPQDQVLVVAPIPGRPAPECPACDQVWRQAEHIPPRTDHEPIPPPPRPAVSATSIPDGTRRRATL
jgi:hypothetical protein